MNRRTKIICRNCGNIGFSKEVIKGSLWITIILLFFYILPGIIYEIWRGTTKVFCCPKCNSQSIIPANTPAARKIEEEFKVD
jgi:hypothetical protein